LVRIEALDEFGNPAGLSEDEDEHEPLVADFGVSSVERCAAL
jgi:hypothetical protein